MGKSLSEEKKSYQIVARILGIFMRIANVCCWIGVGGVVIATVFSAILAPNVKVDSRKKEIILFDKTSSYSIKGKEFEIGDKDGRVKIKDNTILVLDQNSNEVVKVSLSDANIQEIEKFIENDLTRLLATLPFVLILVTALLVVYALALGHGAKVLKNIAKEKTPFAKDNIDRSEKAFKYAIIGCVLVFAVDIIMIAATGIATQGGLGFTSITGILGLYVVIYLLKSGYESKNSDKKTETKE